MEESEITETHSVEVAGGDREFNYTYSDRQYGFTLEPSVAKPNEYSFLLLEAVECRRGSRTLDIGTGVGFLGIIVGGSITKGSVVATDINQKAVETARSNAIINQVPIDVVCGDLFEPVRGETFDIILSQPRQTPTPLEVIEEERVVKPDFFYNTSGGIDGLEFIDALIGQARDHLRLGGVMQIVVVDYLGLSRIFEKIEAGGLRPEIAATRRAWLSPMTKKRRHYIEESLKHTFQRTSDGREYMRLIVITARRNS